MYSTVYVPKCSWLALWGFWRFFFDRAEQKVLELSEPEHFPQQAERAGEHHGTIPFLTLGTTTVSSSAPSSALVRRVCRGHPLADFAVNPGLTLKKRNTARYLPLSFPTSCLGTFSSQPRARVVHQRHGQAASVFCLLPQAPSLLLFSMQIGDV